MKEKFSNKLPNKGITLIQSHSQNQHIHRYHMAAFPLAWIDFFSSIFTAIDQFEPIKLSAHEDWEASVYLPTHFQYFIA